MIATLAARALTQPLSQVVDRMVGPRGCLLTFHRAAPTELWEKLPNRDFYLDLEFIDRFLTHLVAQKWDVVTIGEALRRSESAHDNSRYVNFSIDDCYRDTFELVAPVFRRHNVPLTLFVTTGIPDGTASIWPIGLEYALLERDEVLLDARVVRLSTPEERRAAYRQIASMWDGPDAPRHYAAFCAENRVNMDAMHWAHAITWDMLEALAKDPLIEIGAHTVSHPRISSLAPGDALAEIEGARVRLNQRLGIDVRHFAFPYGRSGDCGPRDFALARKAGFLSAATTRKGLVRGGQDRFSLPRNTINGSHRSVSAMEMHLLGLTGVAARITGRV
jgi:peptidoglycan/xylan/chitin deacetylase (PgdA/CDA1 family)